ncbi:hypothetical protein LTR84_007032 [Exophiala bonariae]|uniref:Prion-inhibition and propagation HeLo domain-containing protein n=1 Tax=Exophiala bonariae TaxID=1690606 RepID=A0AAV9MZE4_9EURO|nr:hypothetical protein LTR84_007032 [Exophiala bonariae]
MEPVGVAIGAVGLIGLFSTCIEGFQLVEKGKYLGKDYDLLETKFSNQRLRLRAWGQACGLMDSEDHDYDSRLDEAELRSSIERTLNHIMITLQNEELLTRRYGLKECSATGNRLLLPDHAIGPISRMHLNATLWKDKFREFKSRLDKTQEQAPLTAKARWAIGDKKKFAELVQDLRELIDDLERLTTFAGYSDILRRQREIISQDVASIIDVETLTSMEEACETGTDAVSNAATFRLSQLHEQALLEGIVPAISCQTKEAHISELGHTVPDLQDWNLIHQQADQTTQFPDQVHHLLQRVKCHRSNSSRLFFDPPVTPSNTAHDPEWTFFDTSSSQQEELKRDIQKDRHGHLCGRRSLHNLEAYLRQNVSLSFIIFHDYECCYREDRNPLTACAEYSIRLLSQDLCESLLSLPWDDALLSIRPKFTLENELKGPFIWLYHSRKSWKVLEDSTNTISHEHLVLLLDRLGVCMAEEYAQVDKLLGEGCIDCRRLSYIFYPGVLLVQNSKNKDGYPKELVKPIESIVFDELISYMEAYRQSSALNVGHQSWGEAQISMNVQKLCLRDRFTLVTEGRSFLAPVLEKLKINDLFVYPLQYTSDRTRLELVERGAQFLACQELKYVSYSGRIPGLRTTSPENRFFINPSPSIERIYFGFRNYFPSDKHSVDVPKPVADDRAAYEEFLSLLPATYPSFSPILSKGVDLHVCQIEPVEWVADPLGALDVKPDMKHLLLSVLSDDTSGPGKQVSSGVGVGARVLLSGRPGTGKKFIVDLLAEASKRPVYRLNLGLQMASRPRPEEFRQRLESFGNVAETFNCIFHLTNVELTGADQSKALSPSLTDIVLDFLRVFNGPLFLSANSDTWKSSVFSPLMDLKIPSEPISRVHRMKVWVEALSLAGFPVGVLPSHRSSYLEWYESGEIDDEVRSVGEFADLHLTDDQIRKTVGYAQRMALSMKCKTLDLELVKKVLTMSSGDSSSIGGTKRGRKLP